MVIDILFVLAVLGLLLAIYKIKFSKENITQKIEEATKEKHKQQIVNTNNDPQQEQRKEQLVETRLNSQEEGWQNSESEQQQEGVDRRKQLMKQQKKKDKQQRKEAQEQYLEQQKEKREKYEKQAEERERLQEQRRRKEDEIIEQLRQAERKRKEEQFNQWKNMFSVEQSGKQKVSQEEQRERAQTFKKQLVGVLKTAKLSLLQDLSHKFKLTTKQIVEKIKELESEQLISGIFDERGKYLVIEMGEWQAIRNYITARGRVKKTDIMVECAKLIKIPQTVEEQLLQLVREEQGAA